MEDIKFLFTVLDIGYYLLSCPLIQPKKIYIVINFAKRYKKKEIEDIYCNDNPQIVNIF